MTLPLVGAAAGIAALGLIWLEWRRLDRRHVGRRIAASVIAVASLALLASERPVTHPERAVAVIATEGADPALVRHLADSARGSVYVLDEQETSRFGASASAVPDIAFVLRHYPATRAAIIVGWGLREGEMDALRGVPARFVAAALPPGIGTVRWAPSVAAGSRFALRGTTTGIAPGTRVRLDDPAGPADSARVAPDSTFSLGTVPKTAARLHYVIRIFGAGGISAETMGVSVVRRALPRLLVVDGAPTFETRYLKDWMAAAGGQLTVRTEISRARYRTTNVNRPVGELGRIDSAALSRYDAVLLDGRSLAGLGTSERSALTLAVRARGLGLIVRLDAVPDRGDRLLAGFGLRASPERVTQLGWDGQVDRRPIALAPLSLSVGEAATVLVTDSAGGVAAARRPLGTGAVAVTLAATPSRWLLGGEPERFASYWSLLIGSVARPDGERWVAEAPARVGAPLRLTRFGTSTAVVAGIVDPDGSTDSVYLAQDRIVSSEWHGTYWPRRTGWHRIRGDSASLDFDVRPARAWRSVQASARRRATEHVTGGSEPFAAAGRVRRWGLPFQLMLFLAFIGAAAVLWSDRAERWRRTPRA